MHATLEALASLSRAAFDDAPASSFVRHAVATLAAGLDVPIVAVLEPGDDPRWLEVTTNVGLPVSDTPVRWPRPDSAAEPTAIDSLDATDASSPSGAGPVPAGVEVRSGLVLDVRMGADEPGLLLVATPHERDWTPEDLELLTAARDLLESGVAMRAEMDRLRQRERRLDDAQRLAHLGSYDWHIASDTNDWSDELFRIYGEEPGSFNPSYERFLSFIHPDDRERVQGVHQQAYATGEPYEMEERIVRADGEERILASTGQVIHDENGVPIRMTGICFDVTEQRRAEELHQRLHEHDLERRQALQINDNVVQGLTTALWALHDHDLGHAADAIEGTLRSARELITDLLGRTDSDLEAGDLRRDEPPPSVVATDIVSDLPAGAAPSGADPSSPAADVAAPVHILLADDADDIRVMLRLGLCAKIEAEIVAEAATGRSAIEAAAATRPDVAIVDLAMPDLDGLEAIPSIAEVSPDTIILVLSGFSAPEMRARAIEAGAHDYIEKGASLEEIVRRLGELLPGRVAKTTSSVDRSGVGAGESPTEFDVLAHELRTPVTVLMGLAATLRSQIESMPSAAVHEILERLERNAAGLERLLATFEDGQRVTGGRLVVHAETVDLDDAVRQVLRDLRAVTDRHPIEVRSPGRCPVAADPHYLSTLVRNLVSNAGRYSPEGAPIEIEIDRDGDDVVLAVTDHGPGVPSGARADLFRPFRRLGATGTGLGLGLTIARGVAEAHGGRLELDEGYGDGARFVTRLPARQPARTGSGRR